MKRRRFPLRVYLAILHEQKMICGCGCGVKMSKAEGIEFDHDRALWDDGEDTPENLRARRYPCHKAKTIRDAKQRAKLTRIESTNGMRERRPNKRERQLAAIKRWGDMP